MKRLFPNILLTAASVLLSVILLEGALALFWPHKIGDHPYYHERYHPIMGWVNNPNVSGEYNLTRKITYRRHHNGKGLRCLREIPYENAKGVKRILLLGDSFVWGYGINDEDVISEVLQRQTGSGVEIINGGAPGYGTDQELLWLTEEGSKYEPDLVVQFFYAANDWQEISRSISYGYPAYPKPFFSLDRGRLSLANVPVPDTRETRREAFNEPVTVLEKVKAALRHHTHTYPFLAKRLNTIPRLREFLLETGLAYDLTIILHDVPVMEHSIDEILPLSEALTREIRRVSKSIGADFLIVFVPEKEYTPGAPPIYENILEGAEARNTEGSAYFTRFAGNNRMQFLDLLPMVRDRQARGEILYVPQQYDHHWTPAGHRLAATALHGWLRDNGYLEADRGQEGADRSREGRTRS